MGAAVKALVVPAANASVDVCPAVARVKALVGYVINADVLPVTLIDGPLQPAPNVHGAVAHAGQLAASPKVVCVAPAAAHMAVVMSVHELEPATDEEPKGHGIPALDPAGQYEPTGHMFVVPTAWPALQK